MSENNTPEGQPEQPGPDAVSSDDQPTEILYDTSSVADQPAEPLAWNLDEPGPYASYAGEPPASETQEALLDAKRQIKWLSGAVAGLAALCLGLGFWGYHQSQESGGGFSAGFGDRDGRGDDDFRMGPGMGMGSGQGGMGMGGRVGGPGAERFIQGLFNSDGTVNSDAAAQFKQQAQSGNAMSLDTLPSLMEHMVGEGRITQEQADSLLKELGLGSTQSAA